MFALDVQGLTKIYRGGFQALKGVDLQVEEGDFFALLGPNGAGKSTFIGIIASLVTKTAGRVSVFGHDLDRDPEGVKSSIGLVPQEFNFNLFLPAIEVLINQAGYYGIPRREARSRAERYLRQLDLWDRRDTEMRRLSGGMKRRLMIARALVHEPRLLILDEPTAGVDLEVRRAMWSFLRELNAQGTTIILTTHYLEEAEALCDRIAIIHNGRITANEDKTTLLSRLDKKTLIITPTTELSEIPKKLRDLDITLKDNGDLSINYRAGKDSISGMLNQVKAAGLSIGDLRTEQPDLEDVFMALTYDMD